MNSVFIRLLKNSSFLKSVVRYLVGFIEKKYVIVKVDGGICSQIHFYLVGTIFIEKGYDVRFNLNWYKTNGKDLENKQVRNFDLLRLSPDLNFRDIKSGLVLAFYKFFLNDNYDYYSKDYNNTTWMNGKPPIYMGSYYHDTPFMFTHSLPKYFRFERIKQCLDKRNTLLFNEVINSQSVAIHVRRGDLVSFSESYGNPCSTNYFSQSVLLFDETFVFYIFSDDTQWCKHELLRQLPKSRKYMVVDINGSDSGYMDLILMAACKHTITSKGSLGKYSACLNNHKDRVVVLNDDSTEYFWKDVFPNYKFIGN